MASTPISLVDRSAGNNRRMTPPLFNAHGLHKRYGHSTVVNNLSFEIAPGECLSIIGPNGAGKTTTVRKSLGLTTVQTHACMLPLHGN